MHPPLLPPQLTQEEDIRTAEEKFDECIGTHEEHLDLLMQRLQQILQNGSKNHLVDSFADLTQKAADTHNKLKEYNVEVQEHIDEDIDKLRERAASEKKVRRSRLHALTCTPLSLHPLGDILRAHCAGAVLGRL